MLLSHLVFWCYYSTSSFEKKKQHLFSLKTLPPKNTSILPLSRIGPDFNWSFWYGSLKFDTQIMKDMIFRLFHNETSTWELADASQFFLQSLQNLEKLIRILTLFFPMLPLNLPKTSENQRFSDVFRGIKRKNREEKG